MEALRPTLRQYFFEGEQDGRPFSRDRRSLVYQRAKGQLDKRPFGTEFDVYDPSYEWISHSLAPTEAREHDFRLKVGAPDCTKPYDASVLNIFAIFLTGGGETAQSYKNRCIRHDDFRLRRRQDHGAGCGLGEHVAQFQEKTLMALAEVAGGAGLTHPSQLRRFHFQQRISESMMKSFMDLYPPLRKGELLTGTEDPRYKGAWQRTQAESFAAARAG